MHSKCGASFSPPTTSALTLSVGKSVACRAWPTLTEDDTTHPSRHRYEDRSSRKSAKRENHGPPAGHARAGMASVAAERLPRVLTAGASAAWVFDLRADGMPAADLLGGVVAVTVRAAREPLGSVSVALAAQPAGASRPRSRRRRQGRSGRCRVCGWTPSSATCGCWSVPASRTSVHSRARYGSLRLPDAGGRAAAYR